MRIQHLDHLTRTHLIYCPDVFFVFSKILDLAFSPLVWATLLLAASLVPKLARRSRALVASSLFLLWFFSLDAVGNGLFRFAEKSAPRTVRDGVTYDVVVLLGGMVEDAPTREHGQISYNDSAERVIATFELLRAHRAKKVLISGGDGRLFGEQHPEADVLAEQLRTWGIESDRIIVERDSRNTHENAQRAASILATEQAKDVLLVTSAFHMRRALGCFRKEGVSTDAMPVDYRSSPEMPMRVMPRADAMDLSVRAIHELVGRLTYRLRGFSVAVD